MTRQTQLRRLAAIVLPPFLASKLLVMLCLSVLVLLLMVGCNDGGSSPPPELYTYTMPAQTGDGWQVGHINDVGINGGLMTLNIRAILCRVTARRVLAGNILLSSPR